MTDIQKFLSDTTKIIKHDRADNGGRYDGIRACSRIAALFDTNNSQLGNLAHSVSEYWMDTCIRTSADCSNEPSEVHLDRLCALQAFLDGDKDGLTALTADDWTNLRDLVDCEAEDLPLDTLEAMMSLILEEGAL